MDKDQIFNKLKTLRNQYRKALDKYEECEDKKDSIEALLAINDIAHNMSECIYELDSGGATSQNNIETLLTIDADGFLIEDI